MDHRDQMAVLAGPFDVETHRATFIRYLEVVLFPDGTICYANPSHIAVMEKVLRLRGELGMPPRERWCDYDGWLMEQTGCVCVWTCGYSGRPNEAQREALSMLADEGLLEAAV